MLSARLVPKFDGPIQTEATTRECIRQEALRRLRCSGYSSLWDISCDVRGGLVQLQGQLPSYYLKQVAQAAVDRVDGVERVVNLIEVSAQRSRTRPSSTASIGSR